MIANRRSFFRMFLDVTLDVVVLNVVLYASMAFVSIVNPKISTGFFGEIFARFAQEPHPLLSYFVLIPSFLIIFLSYERFRWIVPAIDVLLFHLSIVLSFYLVLGVFQGSENFEYHFWSYRDLWAKPSMPLSYAILLPVVVFYLSGLYRRSWYELDVNDIRKVVYSVFSVFIALIVVLYMSREFVESFPTRVILCASVILLFAMSVIRLLPRLLFGANVGDEGRVIRVASVGALDSNTQERLENCYRPRYEVLGYVGKSKDDAISKPLGALDDLPKVIQEHDIDFVLINAVCFTPEQLLDAMTLCEIEGVSFRVIPSAYTMLASTSSILLSNDVPMVEFGMQAIVGWNYFAKRIVDLVFALVASVITAPIVFLACIAIVIESKGTPLFFQKRVGLNGRPFTCFKLRTMIRDAATKGPALTQSSDPRITKVGAFLRATSIDELPQFWNVVLGDMSIIGPRAVVEQVVNQFKDWEYSTLNVKPGITGLAQVSGRDELGFKDKSLLNIYYIRNYSLLLDLKVFARTLWVVLRITGGGGTHQGEEKTQEKKAEEEI